MNNERWLPVLDLVGRYEVSDRGRVRALFVAGKGAYQPGRILRPWKTGRGYRAVGLVAADGFKWRVPVHRLVLETFVGPCPAGMEALHLDNDRTNNALDNLRWGTHLENIRDRERHGTVSRGSKSGMAKVSESDVKDMHARRKAGETQKAIAARYGLHPSNVSRIVRGKLWAHIMG